MDQDEIGLMELFRVLWRGKWIILGCLAVAAGAAAGYLAIQTPTYFCSTEYSVREYLSATLVGSTDAGASFDHAMQCAVSRPASDLKGTDATWDSGRVTITCRGAASLQDAERLCTLAEEALRRNIANCLDEELAFLAVRAQIEEQTLRAQSEKVTKYLTAEGRAEGASAESLASLVVSIALRQAYAERLASVEPSSLIELRATTRPSVGRTGLAGVALIVLAGLLGIGIGSAVVLAARDRRQVR